MPGRVVVVVDTAGMARTVVDTMVGLGGGGGVGRVFFKNERADRGAAGGVGGGRVI